MALDLFCHPHSAGILLHSQSGAGCPERVRKLTSSLGGGKKRRGQGWRVEGRRGREGRRERRERARGRKRVGSKGGRGAGGGGGGRGGAGQGDVG